MEISLWRKFHDTKEQNQVKNRRALPLYLLGQNSKNRKYAQIVTPDWNLPPLTKPFKQELEEGSFEVWEQIRHRADFENYTKSEVSYAPRFIEL